MQRQRHGQVAMIFLDFFAQQFIVADFAARQLRLAYSTVRSGYPRRLMEFLSLSQDDFYGERIDQNYALGWALVYYLLNSRPGREALAAYMQELADRYCEPIDQSVWLTQQYPGGVAGLQRDFYRWVGDTSVSLSR